MTDQDTILGLRALLAGRWFEAHECFERPWRAARGADRGPLQALIHGAVSLEHLRRGNFRGALSQWRKADQRSEALEPWCGGVGVREWCLQLGAFYAALRIEERAALQRGDDAAAGAASADELPPLPAEEVWPRPPLEPWLAAALE